jgi:hypothetical protein
MHTTGEVIAHFAGGAESVTLTKAEWSAIAEAVRRSSAIAIQKCAAERETARVKRIARPLWQACKRVAHQMRECACAATQYQVRGWERQLRNATEVGWHDLPADKRPPARR